VVTDASRAPERDRFSRFVQLGATKPMLLSMDSKNVKTMTIPELIDGTVSLITFNGHYYGQEYADLLADPKMHRRISQVSAPENAMKMLKRGRADAILTAPFVILDAWEQWAEGTAIKVHEVDGLQSIAWGLYFSNAKTLAGDVDVIEKTALKVIQSNEYAKALRVYYPEWLIVGMTPKQYSVRPKNDTIK
jgi:ABC-type amino acid transport substrate-binding protein